MGRHAAGHVRLPGHAARLRHPRAPAHARHARAHAHHRQFPHPPHRREEPQLRRLHADALERRHRHGGAAPAQPPAPGARLRALRRHRDRPPARGRPRRGGHRRRRRGEGRDALRRGRRADPARAGRQALERVRPAALHPHAELAGPGARHPLRLPLLRGQGPAGLHERPPLLRPRQHRELPLPAHRLPRDGQGQLAAHLRHPQGPGRQPDASTRSAATRGPSPRRPSTRRTSWGS